MNLCVFYKLLYMNKIQFCLCAVYLNVISNLIPRSETLK